MLKRFTLNGLVLILFAGVLYIGGKIGYAAYERYLLQLKINDLKAQVAQLADRNKDIALLLSQLGNNDYLLLKTKEAFNLKDPKEKVAIISPNKSKVNDQSRPTENNKPAENKVGDNESNWRKWWDLFFGK